MKRTLSKGLGAVYEEHMYLGDLLPKRFVDEPLCLSAAIIYAQTQDAYLGNQAGQDFLLDATDYVGDKSPRIFNLDVSSLWFRAAIAGATMHILGTTRAYPCVKQ